MSGKPDDGLTLDKPPKDFFRFLVVDDERVARNLLKSILDTHGYTSIDLAESGKQALEAMGQNDYHVVLLDKNMPGMDGIEVLRRGKALRKDCEFIMITAYGSMQTAIEAMDLGAFSYVTKPFADVNIIVKRIEAALEKVSILRENGILLDRLRRVLADLEQAESELQTLQGAAGRPDPPGQVPLDKVRQAVQRLRQLAVQLDTLRERARGAAAALFEKMEQEVSHVADMLEK